MFHISMTYRNLDGVDMVAVDCHVEGHVLWTAISIRIRNLSTHTENPAPQKQSPLGS